MKPSAGSACVFARMELGRQCRRPATALCAFRENLVHDAFERGGGVDDDTSLRGVFFRCVQAHDKRPFARSPAKLVFWSAGEPPVQRVAIDVENENAVKQIDEAEEIS